MYLRKIVNELSKIDEYRNEMEELAILKGLNDPEVLNLSMKIDELINIHLEIQKIRKLRIST